MKQKILLGAFAGAIGGMAMKAVVQFIDRNSFGLSARTDADTAHALRRRMGCRPIREKHARQIGAAMHYGFAVATGAAYAATASLFPLIRAGNGTAFGALLWLIGDEAAVSFSKLADPLRTPFFSHCSAFGAHLLYGVLVDSSLRLTRQSRLRLAPHLR